MATSLSLTANSLYLAVTSLYLQKLRAWKCPNLPRHRLTNLLRIYQLTNFSSLRINSLFTMLPTNSPIHKLLSCAFTRTAENITRNTAPHLLSQRRMTKITQNFCSLVKKAEGAPWGCASNISCCMFGFHCRPWLASKISVENPHMPKSLIHAGK